MTLSRAIEELLENGFIRAGFPNIYTTVDSEVKNIADFPFIRIKTTSAVPIHEHAIIYKIQVEVAVVGPIASSDDKTLTSETHLAMQQQICGTLLRMMPNRALAKIYPLTNMEEVVPTIQTFNETEVWLSGYILTFN